MSQFGKGQYFDFNTPLSSGATNGISLEGLDSVALDNYFGNARGPVATPYNPSSRTPGQIAAQQATPYTPTPTYNTGTNETYDYTGGQNPNGGFEATIPTEVGVGEAVDPTSALGNLQNKKAEWYEAQTGKLNAGPGMGDYISMGADGLGAIVGLANYFDTRSINKVKKQALNQNMAHAAQGRQDKTNFISGTNSAFA